jgi:hypothetical protein
MSASLVTIHLILYCLISAIRIRLIIEVSALQFRREVWQLDFLCQAGVRWGIGWPNKTIVLRVKVHLKASHPFDSDDHILVP